MTQRKYNKVDHFSHLVGLHVNVYSFTIHLKIHYYRVILFVSTPESRLEAYSQYFRTNHSYN